MLNPHRVAIAGGQVRTKQEPSGARPLHTEIAPWLSVRSPRAYPPGYAAAVEFRNGFYRSYIACMRAFFGELRPLKGWERFGIDLPQRR